MTINNIFPPILNILRNPDFGIESTNELVGRKVFSMMGNRILQVNLKHHAISLYITLR